MFKNLFAYGNKKTRSISKWTLGVFALVLLVALTMRVVEALRPNVVAPISDVQPISYQDVQNSQDQTPPTPTTDPTPNPTPTPTVPPEPPTENPPVETPPSDNEVPIELNLAVPFTSQAPFGTWDAFHEETCEEASMLMSLGFYAGTTTLDPTDTDNKFYDMVAVEDSLGMGLSITAAEVKTFVKKYFNREVTIYDNPTADQLKALVAAGKPVIVPAAGRKLGNPFFTGAGPNYHMLVIRGYTESTFITNDPGTRHGQNYVYDIDVLLNAIGDWNDGDPANGAKRVLVIEP